MRQLLIAISALVTVSLPAQQSRYRDTLFHVLTVRDVTYGSALSIKTNQMMDLKMDVYTPTGDPASDRPAVVLVHGGGFTSGSKTHAYLGPLGRALASRGYVAVSIDYRLRPSSPTSYADRLPAIYDLKAAIRYLRRNARRLGIDVERIACLGSSAGAYMCLETAYGSSGPGNSGNPGY
ncbi:MAG: alpha/beta hydrolase, partial [Planctomycetota bacterium]|nr:alpha/beta hydrolase [Planctomycetota bacterium]